MEPKQILFVEATDPHSQIDFEAYCARTKHKIIEFSCTDGIYKFYIERAIDPKKI